MDDHESYGVFHLIKIIQIEKNIRDKVMQAAKAEYTTSRFRETQSFLPKPKPPPKPKKTKTAVKN